MNKILARLALTTWLALSIIGCGYNPDEPLYDIASNEENFPPAALDLIAQIDSDQELDVEDVITNFVDLYSSSQELLDNPTWKEIVNRMGHKLRLKADRLVTQGIENYLVAADHYQLASFARPGDERLQKVSDRFGCWKSYDSGTILEVAASNTASGFSTQTLKATIESLKKFAYTDSVHFEFARLLLVDQLLKNPYRQNAASSDLLDSLSDAECAFLACWELTAPDYDSLLCSFESPEIDLVLFDILSLGSNQYRAEFYFSPRASIEHELSIAFWVDADDSRLAQSDRPISMSLPFDFNPLPPTRDWQSGRMVIAVREFESSDDIGRISLGLYRNDEAQVIYMPIKGIQGNLIRLPATPRRMFPGDGQL